MYASPAQKDTIRVDWFVALLYVLYVISLPLERQLLLLLAVTITFVPFVVALGRSMVMAILIVILGSGIQMQSVAFTLKLSRLLKVRRQVRLCSLQLALDGLNY